MKRTGIIILALMLVTTVFSLPGAAQEAPAAIITEIEENAKELSTIAENIHDETEYIADDESLEEALRAKGEEVHLSSHNISHCAETLLRSVETLNELAADPEANAAALEAELIKLEESTEECAGVIEVKSSLVHELQSEVPETHSEYADNIHNEFHTAETIIRELKKSSGALKTSLGIDKAAAAPVEAAVSTSLASLEENANLLLEEAGKVHDETEYIADDEALSEEIRAVGEEIHLSSHDLKHCADAVLEHVETLRGLVGDSKANKAAIEEEIKLMNSNLTACTEVISSKHDKLHELTGVVPETHTEYADNIHDYYHEAEYLVADLQENVNELQNAIENPTSKTPAGVKSAPESETPETEEKTEKKTPGFGLCLALAGLLCMVFGAKKIKKY